MILENNLYEISSYNLETGYFKLRLIRDCIIYKAHFPEQPITPGVCIIQIVSELLNKQLKGNFSLKKVANAKFLKAIEPDVTPEIEVNFQKIEEKEADSSVKVSATITSGPDIYSKLLIIYSRI